MNPASARPSLGQEGAFMADALAHRASDAILVVHLPAPLAPVDRLLVCPRNGIGSAFNAFLWDRAGTSFVGLGSAVRLSANGAARFSSIRAGATAAWARVECRSMAGAPAPAFVGGFAFRAGPPPTAWRALGDATFTLPRWRYATQGERAFLTFVSASASDRVEDVLREWAQLRSRLDGTGRPDLSEGPREVRVRQTRERTWGRQIHEALEAIDAGAFEKLVLARVTRVRQAESIDLGRVLAALAARQVSGTRFLFRERQSAFLGLTPERLVSLSGRRVTTQALAGTTAPGRGRGAALLSSAKDDLEHRLVVRDIVRRLRPLCERVSAVAAQPRLESFPNVLHLGTPIRAAARPGTHVLDLVAALHPTPAVAGLPADEAVEWLGRHEAEPRGWYAGPIGWFDAAGNGDFAVAIRSALISGAQARVYAGAGIVRGSQAAAEYAETGLKQRLLLEALGAAS